MNKVDGMKLLLEILLYLSAALVMLYAIFKDK